MKAINAIITRADIKLDGVFLTMGMTLDLENGGAVGFGGSRLLFNKAEQFSRTGNNCAGFFITRVMTIARAEKFSELKGKPIRAIFEKDAKIGDRIIGIQDFLNNERFIPEEVFDNEDR